MKIKLLKNEIDPNFKRFKEIYDTSFPVFEQRTLSQQIQAFASEKYQLECYIDEKNEFIGFISYWEFEKYIYIEHFAINPLKRGLSLGSFLIKNFIHEKNKCIILEIDPIKDEVSVKRLKFYTNAGFKENPYKHFHPPYRKEYSAHELKILTSPNIISKDEYNEFLKTLSNIVMKFQ